MGLIRKTLFVSSAGLVRPNSKKQRVAKAQLRELRQQTQLMREEAEYAREQAQQGEYGREGPYVPAPAPSAASPGPAVQREQEVQALWRLYKSGVLTKEQYSAAYAALPPLVS